MRRPLSLLLLVLGLAGGDALAGRDRVADAIRDLSSPFLETRESAVRILAGGGAEAGAAMAAAYPQADFRAKALILDACARGDTLLGRKLLVLDLGSSDRGVVNAQRELVLAIYRHAARIATGRVVPLLPRGDWEWEEGIRCLPGRGPSARRAFARLLDSPLPRHATVGRELAEALTEVILLREDLAAARAAEDPAAVAAVRELQRLLIRLDVERAFFAVHRAGGGDGSYDGMYDAVKEVVECEGPVALEVLFWILDDVAPPEMGVPPARSARYPFLEPVPLDMTDSGVRRRAAFCLGDVGTPELAPRLAERYETFEKEDLDPYDTPRQDLAHACAVLGDTGPLREIIDEYLDMRWGGSESKSRLAACYARLGDFEKAAWYFAEANDGIGNEWIYFYNLACAQSRLGRPEEALDSLRAAVQAGYGQDPSNIRWMERDGDLADVRKLPGYQRLLKELRSRFE